MFQPAAGYRRGTSVGNVGSDGIYWSASYNCTDYAWYVDFYDGDLYTDDYNSRYYGFSVRLVRSAQ